MDNLKTNIKVMKSKDFYYLGITIQDGESTLDHRHVIMRHNVSEDPRISAAVHKKNWETSNATAKVVFLFSGNNGGIKFYRLRMLISDECGVEFPWELSILVEPNGSQIAVMEKWDVFGKYYTVRRIDGWDDDKDYSINSIYWMLFGFMSADERDKYNDIQKRYQKDEEGGGVSC